MQTKEQILRRQQQVLDDMGRITRMRRGTLSRQEYPQRRERKQGEGAAGPYFL
ncbi:MAG: hypothetical protein HYZ00_07800, partial [Candidatus Hydrogenedentes bacterium]|nr:hypothetical protein [Candidatus Hydrogenedentota bacterium]